MIQSTMFMTSFLKLEFLLRGKSFDLQQRADLDRADFRRWHTFRDAHRFIEIFCIDNVVPPELFARLGKWTISHQSLAVSYTQARCGRHRMQRTGRNVLA